MRTPLPHIDPTRWLATCGVPSIDPPPLAGADLTFTLTIGFVAGAATVAALWLVDRWRNRPILLED
jgi:hypothetical protein